MSHNSRAGKFALATEPKNVSTPQEQCQEAPRVVDSAADLIPPGKVARKYTNGAPRAFLRMSARDPGIEISAVEE